MAGLMRARRRIRRGWTGVWVLGAVIFWAHLGASAQGLGTGTGTAPDVTPEPPIGSASGGALHGPVQLGNPNNVDAVHVPSPSPSHGAGGGGVMGPSFQIWPAPAGSAGNNASPDDPQSPGAGPVAGEDTSPVGRHPH